jgi:hypothetical protein
VVLPDTKVEAVGFVAVSIWVVWLAPLVQAGRHPGINRSKLAVKSNCLTIRYLSANFLPPHRLKSICLLFRYIDASLVPYIKMHKRHKTEHFDRKYFLLL